MSLSQHNKQFPFGSVIHRQLTQEGWDTFSHWGRKYCNIHPSTFFPLPLFFFPRVCSSIGRLIGGFFGGGENTKRLIAVILFLYFVPATEDPSMGIQRSCGEKGVSEDVGQVSMWVFAVMGYADVLYPLSTRTIFCLQSYTISILYLVLSHFFLYLRIFRHAFDYISLLYVFRYVFDFPPVASRLHCKFTHYDNTTQCSIW